MLLSKAEIQNYELIKAAADKQYRAAGYDITIDRIINENGEEVEDGYRLPPSGVVEVISKERVQLPRDISGYAFIKTGLCNQGVLALNIGIIDPGYAGLMSTTLVNFGKSSARLSKGDTFLRLTFHRYEQTEEIQETGVDDNTYIKNRKNEAFKNFGNKFLQTDEIATEAAQKAITVYWRNLSWYIPIAATGISVLIAVFTISVAWALNQFAFSDISKAWTPDHVAEKIEAQISEARADKREILNSIGSLEKRLEGQTKIIELERDLRALENQLIDLTKAISQELSQQPN